MLRRYFEPYREASPPAPRDAVPTALSKWSATPLWVATRRLAYWSPATYLIDS